MPKAILSNYLWVKKADVRGSPAQFAPEWEYRIDLLKTSEGKIAQQQIAFLREQATANGDDPDDVAKELTESDKLVVKNWSEVGDWWALCLGDQTKVKQLADDLGLTLEDRRVEKPWPDELLGRLKTLMTPRDNQTSVMKKWSEANHGILQAAPAFGKAQPVDEVVLTPTGWVPIGSLKIGDSVIGSTGKPCQVTGVFPQGQRPVRMLRFSDGASVRADVDHLWAVKNSSDERRSKPWRILTTQQIEESVREPCGEARWKVPTVVVQGEDKELPLDPYVLGVLIGDGCMAEYLASPMFSSVDEEVVRAVDARLPDGFRCVLIKDASDRTPSYRVSRPTSSFEERKSTVKEALKSLNLWGCLSNTKFIPDAYMLASAEQRRALLMGLMDTDGWSKGSQFSTVSERLALDVVQLVRSLGGTARLSSKETSYVYRGERRVGQVSYMVTIKADFTPFLLERKKLVYERRPRKPVCRKIVAIEDAGVAECVCISVDAPDQLYVTKDYVVTHNTFVMISSVISRQQYTIVLVHTDALADQFITRFRNGSPNDDGGYTPITNCLEVEKELGYEVVGRYKGPDELYPVTVATWQSFTSPSGKKALKAISKSFGYVLTDESHVFAAPAPASVVNGFHAKVRQGVTATPKRKDQLDVALYDVLGPVTAHGKAAQLPITSYLISTGCKYPPRKYPSRAEWAKIINWLMKQEDRNQLIFDWVKHDVRVEDRNVLILGDRVKWALEAAEILTKEFKIPAKAVIGGMNTKRGLEERARTIQDMMDRRIRVITATSVFKAGIDIPNLDTLYYVVPQNNVSQLQQALGRVRRKYEDKKSPVFRYFVDEGHGLLFGCARGTHKALVEEDSEIVIVNEGRKPGQVHANRVFDDDRMVEARGFKAVASKQREAMSALFTDLRQEEKLKEEYNRRLGRKKT